MEIHTKRHLLIIKSKKKNDKNTYAGSLNTGIRRIYKSIFIVFIFLCSARFGFGQHIFSLGAPFSKQQTSGIAGAVFLFILVGLSRKRMEKKREKRMRENREMEPERIVMEEKAEPEVSEEEKKVEPGKKLEETKVKTQQVVKKDKDKDEETKIEKPPAEEETKRVVPAMEADEEKIETQEKKIEVKQEKTEPEVSEEEKKEESGKESEEKKVEPRKEPEEQKAEPEQVVVKEKVAEEKKPPPGIKPKKVDVEPEEKKEEPGTVAEEKKAEPPGVPEERKIEPEKVVDEEKEAEEKELPPSEKDIPIGELEFRILVDIKKEDEKEYKKELSEFNTSLEEEYNWIKKLSNKIPGSIKKLEKEFVQILGKKELWKALQNTEEELKEKILNRQESLDLCLKMLKNLDRLYPQFQNIQEKAKNISVLHQKQWDEEKFKEVNMKDFEQVKNDLEMKIKKIRDNNYHILREKRELIDEMLTFFFDFFHRYFFPILDGLESGKKFYMEHQDEWFSKFSGQEELIKKRSQIYDLSLEKSDLFLKEFHIEQIPVNAGDEYDEMIHDPFMTEKDDKLNDNQIKEVGHKGYQFVDPRTKEKYIIRAPRVIVVANK